MCNSMQIVIFSLVDDIKLFLLYFLQLDIFIKKGTHETADESKYYNGVRRTNMVGI